MSCVHVSLELRPKTSETISSAYKEDCSKWSGWSIRTDEQQCLSMKTMLTVDLTQPLITRLCNSRSMLSFNVKLVVYTYTAELGIHSALLGCYSFNKIYPPVEIA